METKPKSSFVTALAIMSIIIAVYLGITDLNDIFSYQSLMNSPEYGMAARQLQTIMPDESSIFLNSQWMMISNVISLVLSTAAIAASIGLLRRKVWGRVSYIWLLWIQSLYYIATAVGGYYLAKSIIEQSGLRQYSALSGLMTLGGGAAFFGAFISIAIAAFFTWKLSTKIIREEFR